LLFYQTIEDFKKKVESCGSILMDKDYHSIYESALGIYETFIKPNANFEVNVEYNIKAEYIKLFEKENPTMEEKKLYANVKLFDNIQIRTISIMELGFPK
jgi:ABC-type long-subunit fatty acid transport system fused permease/ATPase subunit